jgi:hypothetical protein
MTEDEDVDVVALVEAELAADPTLPEPLKAAIVERAREVSVRRLGRAVGSNAGDAGRVVSDQG